MTTPHCDHSSVGVLVWRDARLLLIERKREPFGFAPPAGHVDDHGSFEDAARAELFEETGLEAGEIELIAQGYRENRCRRPRGYWHYWKIYRAEFAGEVNTSEDEVVSHRWCAVGELSELAAKTLRHIESGSSQAEMRADPGLEVVWVGWLAKIGLLEGVKPPDPATL